MQLFEMYLIRWKKTKYFSRRVCNYIADSFYYFPIIAFHFWNWVDITFTVSSSCDISKFEQKGFKMKSYLKNDPFTSTPLVTINSMGKNVKRIYLEKKAEIFGK